MPCFEKISQFLLLSENLEGGLSRGHRRIFGPVFLQILTALKFLVGHKKPGFRETVCSLWYTLFEENNYMQRKAILLEI